MNWTKEYKQKKINEFSNEVLDEVLKKIAQANIEEFKKQNLNNYEIKILLRWNFYFSINTFTERFLRVKMNKNIYRKKQRNPIELFKSYFKNLTDSTLAFYNNEELNENLLHNLNYIIWNPSKKNIKINEKKTYNNFKRNSGLSFLKSISKLYIYKYFYNIEELHEGTDQLNMIFSKKGSFINYPFFENIDISNNSRLKIRDICEKIFIKKYSKFFYRNKIKLNSVSKLFSYWLDSSIPTSLLESLNDRFIFYKKIIDILNIKALHASVGFFTNENIKIASILLKRRKIKVFGHEHGVNNFIIPGKNSFMSHYKGLDQFMIPDIFCSWGKGQKSDKWKNIKNFNIRVIDQGSVYLHQINNLKDTKFAKKIRSSNQNYTYIFYCASQFRKFMTNLEEISTEENYKHKVKVCNFLKKILIKKNLRLIYKQFPESSGNTNDPFFKILKYEIKAGKIIISNENAIKIMHCSDIILFDLVSTGFSEAININKPSLVYTNNFEYSRASPEGKKINDLFYNAGIFFDNNNSAIRTMSLLIKNSKLFQKNTENLLKIFKQKISYPANKSIFLKKIKDSY